MHVHRISRSRRVVPPCAQELGTSTGDENVYQQTWAFIMLFIIGAVYVPRKL